ncbi:type VII secretion integral membrane protein EccD [Mycobacterium sp. DL592]|uniref:type VII secretion integral membrane protein EccD n=1 Tax=Mycobacterium sp. DL592 TaxID=2675524 RepID=UPI00141DA446|nr:type VII secretion integral membrane protein EccD [Mycobacterium sp. DL592]
MTVNTGVCLVSIRTARTEAELALPADRALSELLPALAEAMGEHPSAAELHLIRPDGAVVDSTRPLAQCGVRDGDVLFLAPADGPAPYPGIDVSSVLARVAERTDHRPPAPGSTWAVLTVVWSATTVAILICLAARAGGHDHIVCGCAAATFTLGAAVKARPQRWLSLTSGAAAVALAALTALLTAPGLAGFLLAMSAVGATALVAWRVLDRGAEAFVPLAAVGMSSAVISATAVVGWVSVPAVGPLLATTGAGVLAWSPRLATVIGGLSPSSGGDDIEVRATQVHQTLTGLVTVGAATMTLGAILSAVFAARPAEAAAFIGVTAVNMLLRSRIHGDRRQRSVLLIAGGVTATVFAARLAVSAPWAVGLPCGLTVVAAIVAVALRSATIRLSPSEIRLLTVVDAVVSAAVAPSACAAAGAFSAIGGLL